MKKSGNSRRVYICVMGLFAVLALFCVIRIAMPNKTYDFQEDVLFPEGVNAENVVIYDGISLPAGGYEVEVFYETDGDLKAHINLQDGTVFHGGLKTNGEHTYANASRTGFHAWLYESTEQMQVIFTGKEDAIAFHGVRFTETNQLWTMLLTVILFAAFVTFLGLQYHYHWSAVLTVEQKAGIWGVLLIATVSSFISLTGEGLKSIDLTFHYMRIEGVADGFVSGQLPVRIEPEWLFGQGFGCGIFYCNGLLVLPGILRLLGFTVVASTNIFFVTMNLLTATIAYHCFRKIFGSYRVGLACSALYTLSTYRIYKLYQTGDFGDGTALTFYPLVIYGYYRVFTENPESKKYKTAWLPLALGYAGFMQTHVLTCEITLFVTILLCLVCIKKVIKKRVFVELAKGAAGAFALSLWYLVPFADYYLTQDIRIKHFIARIIQARGATPVHMLFHFWLRGEYTPQGNNGALQTYPVGIGLMLLVGLAAFLIIWFNGFPRTEKGENHLKFGKLSAVFGTLLVVMSLNSFPWDRLQRMSDLFAPLISSMEFPTRVLGWATAFLICVFGVCLWYFEKNGWNKCFWAGILVVLISITTSTCYMSENVLVDAGTFTVYNEEGMGSGFVSDSEFVLEGTKTGELTVENPVWPEVIEVRSYEKNYLSYTVDCANPSDEESYMDVPILSYRDYRARTATGEELQVTYNERMQVRVMLPAGFDGQWTVAFEPPVYWRICELVSLASGVLLVVYCVRTYGKRRRKFRVI